VSLAHPVSREYPLLSETCFDAEEAILISKAFGKTCRALHDAGQPEATRETIARRIIAIADRGERDPDQMCETVLTSLGVRTHG
jgi:hypothetical protein